MSSDPPPFTKFHDTFSDLGSLLDSISSATDPSSAASAYGDACSGKRDYGKDSGGNVVLDATGQPSQVTVVKPGAKDVLQPVIDGLSSDQVDDFEGLNFTDPDDDTKKRTDILNSAYSAWDKSAGAYMKLDTTTGDTERANLESRLQEFDAAVQGDGDPAVSPDQ
jgi:hypothetical protein